VARPGGAGALRPSRTRVPPRALGDAPGPTRLGAPHRARRHAPWDALHRLRVQRLRAHAGDRALGGDAHPAGARAALPPGLGRPLLLGLSAVPGFRPPGWRARIEAPRPGNPATG